MIIAVDSDGNDFEFGPVSKRDWNGKVSNSGLIEVQAYSEETNFFPLALKGFKVNGQFWACGALSAEKIREFLADAK